MKSFHTASLAAVVCCALSGRAVGQDFLAAEPTVLDAKSSGFIFSADGKRLAVNGPEDIRLWDVGNAKLLHRLPTADPMDHRTRVTAFALNADGSLLAAGNYGGILKVWDVATGKERFSVRGSGDRPHPIAALAFLAGKGLVSVSQAAPWSVPTYEINVRNLETGRVIRTLKGKDTSSAGPVSLSRDGRYAAVVSLAFEIVTVWDIAAGAELFAFKESAWTNVCFSADGKSMAACVREEGIVVWDMATGRAMHRLLLPGKQDYAGMSAFSPDGKRVAATVHRRVEEAGRLFDVSSLRIWDVASSKEVLVQENVATFAFSPDGKQVAAVHSGPEKEGKAAPATLVVWEVTSNKELGRRELEGPADTVTFSPDGSRLAVARTGGDVLVWKTR